MRLQVLSAGLPRDYQYGYCRPLPNLISTSTSIAHVTEVVPHLLAHRAADLLGERDECLPERACVRRAATIDNSVTHDTSRSAKSTYFEDKRTRL